MGVQPAKLKRWCGFGYIQLEDSSQMYVLGMVLNCVFFFFLYSKTSKSIWHKFSNFLMLFLFHISYLSTETFRVRLSLPICIFDKGYKN